jgi:hypothetical protein
MHYSILYHDQLLTKGHKYTRNECNVIWKSSPKPRKVVARVLGKEESSSRSPKKLMNCGKRATVTNVVSKNVYSCVIPSEK